MGTLKIKADDLGLIFKEYLSKPEYYFVFSTDVVKNSWIDWIILNPKESGCDAVSLERFIAWDQFKSQFVKGRQEDKTAIPAILRKFYIQNLISQNALNPFFKKIINPEFRNEASSFTNWISKLLPGLKQWHDLRSNIEQPLDDEDQDYELLYNRYSQFLNSNSMFEPSWIESDFTTSDKKFIIIFPEILEDFCDYEETLTTNENITLITIDTSSVEENGVRGWEYTDSRKELRRTLLQIRKLADEGVEYTDISLSVPDLDTYRPYLEREFTKYCIPYVIRQGIPLLSVGESGIFKKFQECNSSNFSYNSVRSIVLDDFIPWKDEFSAVRENLIQLGYDMRCLCGYDEDGRTKDIWEIALNDDNRNYREKSFYLELKNEIQKITQVSSFRGIIQAWEHFKDTFLDTNNFTESANNIISRCIVHLQEFTQIEELYFEKNNLLINNPYDFFITELSGKTYTPQSKNLGVNVYPYKLSAAAKIKYQFVIDGSQNNLEIVYKRLGFLNNEKRKLLGLVEKDKKFNPTKAFVTLYAKNPHNNLVTFSYAQNTFSGFAISHNLMNLVTGSDDKPLKNPLKELDEDDFILGESKAFLNHSIPENFKFTKSQKDQFNLWYETNKKRFTGETKEQTELSSEVLEKIQEVLVTNRHKKDPDSKKMVITQSDMRAFFDCPRKWLFSNILKLQDVTLDTSLLQPYDMGNLHHRILELYMKEFEQKGNPLPKLTETNELPDYNDFYKRILTLTEEAITDSRMEFHNSPLVITMLTAQKEQIAETIINFLQEFLKTYGGYYVCGIEKAVSYEPKDKDYVYFGIIDTLLSNMEENAVNGEWQVIDYKNSKAAIPSTENCYVQEENGKKILGDFQMPMYLKILEKTTNKSIQKAGFFPINAPDGKKMIVDNEATRKKISFEDFEPTLAAFEEYTCEFNEKVKKSSFAPKDGNITTWDNCVNCGFKGICRYSYTIAGKDLNRGN